MKSCIIFIAACFALWNPVLALGREFDGDEFSNDTLAYKLELLNHTFWRTEQELSSRGVVGPRLDQVRSAWIEKNHLETQFLRGNFYPDLLDERISLLREKLREMLATMSSPALREPELQNDLYAMPLTPERSSIQCFPMRPCHLDLDSESDASTGPIAAPSTRKSDLSAGSTPTAPPGSSRKRWL